MTTNRKRLLRQYFRYIPARLGWINKAAFLHQIKQINADDIFIVSYPKSGNTWLRFIVAYLKAGVENDINFYQLENIVPDIYRSKDIIDSQKSNRIIKSHNTYFQDYKKVIYIHRDYRDVLVSMYYYAVGLKRFTGTFSEFIRKDRYTDFDSWKNHVSAAIQYKSQNPEKCLLLSYEKLSANFVQNVQQIAQFCNFNTNIDWEKLRQKTQFDALKENENTYGSFFMQASSKNFIREGKVGGWKKMFSEDDLSFLYSDKELVLFMQTLGYEC